MNGLLVNRTFLKYRLFRKHVDIRAFFCHACLQDIPLCRTFNTDKKLDYKEETMAGLFDKIKKDLKKGVEEGIAVVKEGASVVSAKMGELTAEGKRQYKMFDLKAKIQNQMTELGGRAYDILDNKKSPAADSKIKTVFVKIKNLEKQLRKLEGEKETKAPPKKKPAAKTKAAPKKTARPAAKKTTPQTTKKSPAKSKASATAKKK